MIREKICFLVGSMSISGGTYVIIQHAAYLHKLGYDVTLAIQEDFTRQTLTWHDQAFQLRCLPIKSAQGEQFDLVIATWWKTVFELRYFKAARFAYFVQSIESRFYPSCEIPLRALVNSTYQLPLIYVTEANWIQNHLQTNYGQNAALVRNGIRKDIYQPIGPNITQRKKNCVRILVEGPFGVSFKNTALGVRLAREAGSKDIWVLTASPIKWLPGVSRVFSRVPMHFTPNIYRSCDILIKLSTVEGMFGPPLEIFHCGGTALVFNVSGHDEYIINRYNACVVRLGEMDEVVSTLRSLMRNQEELVRLQAGALNTAENWISWDESSAVFLNWVELALSSSRLERGILTQFNEKAYADYRRDEEKRLNALPKISRSRLRTLAARLPHSMLPSIKQLEAAWEVRFSPRMVR